jgi:hypothetical protein
VHQLADGSLGHSHRRGDLGAAAAVERGADDRLPLAHGQARQLGECIDCQGALLHDVFDRLVAGGRAVERYIQRRVRPRRRVAHDPIEPAAKVLDIRPGAQRRKRAEKRLLDDVLGLPVRTETTRERGQLRAVALDDHRERSFVPGAGEFDQALVGHRPQCQFS